MKLGGHTEQYRDEHDRLRVRWVPHKIGVGVPYDTPILGYRNNTANTLRLWKAEAPESFDFSIFNRGDYYGAVKQKVSSENLSKVLYPNDEQIQGKELRLEQQYFFVSLLAPGHAPHHAGAEDPARALPREVRRAAERHASGDRGRGADAAAGRRARAAWEQAWAITRKTFAYTNHTLLPEALECWPLALFGRVLPRHLEIIFEINARFLDEVRIRFSATRSGSRACR